MLRYNRDVNGDIMTNIIILETAKKVINIELAAIKKMNERINDNFCDAVNLILNSRGRIIITGMGKSGAIGKKIASTLMSTGTTSYFLHPAEGVHGDLGMVHKDDVVIAISKSGETQEILSLIPTLSNLKVPIIVITGNLKSSLARYSTVTLDISVEKEACPYDLAPTASTTVTLVMGDALAVALLEGRGFSIDEYALLHPGGALGNQMLLRVEDVMETGDKLPFCNVTASMKTAVIEMSRKRGICPIILEDRRVVGVITAGDLNRLIEQNENFIIQPITETMTKNPKIIFKNELAAVAYKIMEEHQILAMPVLNSDKKLVGVVHLHDLMQKGIK